MCRSKPPPFSKISLIWAPLFMQFALEFQVSLIWGAIFSKFSSAKPKFFKNQCAFFQVFSNLGCNSCKKLALIWGSLRKVEPHTPVHYFGENALDPGSQAIISSSITFLAHPYMYTVCVKCLAQGAQSHLTRDGVQTHYPWVMSRTLYALSHGDSTIVKVIACFKK
jgi:hypothetical protein